MKQISVGIARASSEDFSSLSVRIPQLVARGSRCGDGLEKAIQAKCCLRTAQEEISVGSEQPPQPGENILLHLNIKINEDITHKDQIQVRECRPGFGEVDVQELQRSAQVVSNLPI